MRWSLEHFGLAFGSTKEYLRKSIYELKVDKETPAGLVVDCVEELLKNHKLSGTATEDTLSNKIGHIVLWTPIPRVECIPQIVETLNRAISDPEVEKSSEPDNSKFHLTTKLYVKPRGIFPQILYEDSNEPVPLESIAWNLKILSKTEGYNVETHIVGNEQISHNVMGMAEDMVLEVLPIPSTLARSKNRAMDEVLSNIIRLNHQVSCLAEKQAPSMIIEDIVSLVQYYLYVYMDNTIPGVTTFTDSEGEELQGIAQLLGKPIDVLDDRSNSIGHEIAGTSIQRMVRCLNSGERVIQVNGGDVQNLAFEMAKQCAFQLLWPDSKRATQCYHIDTEGMVREMLIEEIHGAEIQPWSGAISLPDEVIINVKARQLPLKVPNNAEFLKREAKIKDLKPYDSYQFNERVAASMIYDQVAPNEAVEPEQKVIIIERDIDYLLIHEAYQMLSERAFNANIAVIIHTKWVDDDVMRNMALFKYKPTPDAHRNVIIALAEMSNQSEFRKHRAYFEQLDEVVMAKLTNLMKHIPRQMVKRLLASTMVEFGTLDLDFLRNWVASICSEKNYDTTHLHPTVSREKVDLQELETETEPNSDSKEEDVEEVIQAPDAPKIGTSWSDLKGMESFVNWAKGKGRLFTPEAKEFGFTRYPTGVILTGVPGCGKTMAAKIISHEWSMNFKRVTIDMVTSKFMGGNEEKMQELLEELEDQAPIVCFVDEAEKLFAQVRTGDLYQSSDAARDATESLLLQFMEENESGVFFVFTSNEIEKLSPALLDRFDERFFIDLPSDKARREMVQSMLEERKKVANEYDLSSLAKASEGFTGRDIRSAIEEAMMNAFMENRELSTKDLLSVFQNLTPTSVTASTQINKMRQLVVDGKVRSANTHEGKVNASSSFDPSIG
ncbi:MAG: AAA family ATPase [Euryarchaeota archaeon]|nr:AAA family ATPase [Euryarchaeota archaeon]